MRTRNIITDQKGFTLIEIIAVLVILGVLAAVAVPKYMDLQTNAKKMSLTSVTNELQSRANLIFGTNQMRAATGGTTNTVDSIGELFSSANDFADFDLAPELDGATGAIWTGTGEYSGAVITLTEETVAAAAVGEGAAVDAVPARVKLTW